MQLSIVIPCYNEAETIDRLVSVLDKAVADLGTQGHDTELIVVDDGSSDTSFEKLERAAQGRPWLRIIRFRRNYGQTAALAAGFRAATGQVLIPMDADLQNDPSDIPRLLAKLDQGYDVVSGWRRERKDKMITRKIPSWIANWIIGHFLGLPLHDYGCTLKAYRREFLESVNLYGEMHRFIPVYAKWAGARVTELAVTHHPRREGRSKYGVLRTFKVLLDLATVKFLGDYSTKPLYLFGGLGFVLCSSGVVVAAFTLFQKLVEHIWVHRNPLLVIAVFLFMLGVQLIMLGLLAEIQIRTYHEASAKPTYLVRQTVNLDAAALAVRQGRGQPRAG
jgi:glycosyltransferase involved in cell wall biosynthesis